MGYLIENEDQLLFLFRVHCKILLRRELQTSKSFTPTSPPIKCNSSITNKLILCTFFLCFQRLDKTSHLSGVLIMMFPCQARQSK